MDNKSYKIEKNNLVIFYNLKLLNTINIIDKKLIIYQYNFHFINNNDFPIKLIDIHISITDEKNHKTEIIEEIMEDGKFITLCGNSEKKYHNNIISSSNSIISSYLLYKHLDNDIHSNEYQKDEYMKITFSKFASKD